MLDEDTGVDRKIGKAMIDLGDFGATSEPKEVQLPVDKGNAVMFLKIGFITALKGELSVTLERVENLRDRDLIGKSDPYVTFYLEQDNKLFDKGFGKKESSHKKDELSPVYNETFLWEDVQALKRM